jgi:uncharacterized protein YjbJ (UPF0337 family)
MDNDQIDRSANEVEGSVNQRVGKAIAGVKLESDGKADKPNGKVEAAVRGRLRFSERDVLRSENPLLRPE